MKYELDIFEYLGLYKKELKKIACFMILAMAVTMATSMFQPTMYRSTLIALSPKQGSAGGQLGSFLNLAGLSMSSSSDELIFSMLKSRRMRDDINKRFNPDGKRKISWFIDTYLVTGGFAVEVKGFDTLLTRDIANFSVENIDKINMELQISPQKSMVKVLDPAMKGIVVGKNISKKMILSGLFVFLAYALFIFFKEYFSKLRESKKDRRI